MGNLGCFRNKRSNAKSAVCGTDTAELTFSLRKFPGSLQSPVSCRLLALAGLVLCFPDKNIGVGVTDENCDSGGNNSTIEAASKD